MHSTGAAPIRAALRLALCAALYGLGSACGDDDAPAPLRDAGNANERVDAADDAAMTVPPRMDSGQVDAAGLDVDGSFTVSDAEAPFCALHVAAECDGAEDCGDGVCCATFDPFNVTYSAIRCQDTCQGLDELALCHAGQACTADQSLVCHQSLLIGQPFIGVCVPKEHMQLAPHGAGVSGEIACGDESCIVGAEHCCLRTSFSFSTLQSTPLEPYCALLDTPCDCGEDVADQDAGAHDPEDDAGR